MNSSTPQSKSFSIHKQAGGKCVVEDDSVAVEEPMEIRLVFGPAHNRQMRPISVTMRTPGNDGELAAGFLFSEGILTSNQQINSIEFRGVDQDGVKTENIVRVNLEPDVEINFKQLQRNFFSNSSCGVCGKSSLESLDVQGIQPIKIGAQRITFRQVSQLPSALRNGQPTFDQTGGIHAAGFADFQGALVEVREDIGRHNAVDKLIGSFFQQGRVPATESVMVVSGRASFEIVQKAIVAQVPMMVAVGAPSSLAVELARKYQMTLVGFAGDKRFNIYSAESRIQPN